MKIRRTKALSFIRYLRQPIPSRGRARWKTIPPTGKRTARRGRGHLEFMLLRISFSFSKTSSGGNGSMIQISQAATILKPLVLPATASARPCVRGKFIFIGKDKFYVRGVTYGTFRPDANGNEYHNLETIERDFAEMAANGINTVRVYNVPPRSLFDVAQRHGLRVMVGLSAEQYVGFLIDKKKRAPNIEELERAKVRAIARHPSLLCYAIGNEIPGPIARWLGRRQVERYLEQFYRVAKAEDPNGLVTYVNYP